MLSRGPVRTHRLGARGCAAGFFGPLDIHFSCRSSASGVEGRARDSFPSATYPLEDAPGSHLRRQRRRHAPVFTCSRAPPAAPASKPRLRLWLYVYYWAPRAGAPMASGDSSRSTLADQHARGTRARRRSAVAKIQPPLCASCRSPPAIAAARAAPHFDGTLYVEGAEPARAEVKILSIDFVIDYGYTAGSGFLPETATVRSRRNLPIDRKRISAEFKPGVVIRCGRVFGSMGVGAGPELAASSAIRRAARRQPRHSTGRRQYGCYSRIRGGALFKLVTVTLARRWRVDQTRLRRHCAGAAQLTVRQAHGV